MNLSPLERAQNEMGECIREVDAIGPRQMDATHTASVLNTAYLKRVLTLLFEIKDEIKAGNGKANQ